MYPGKSVRFTPSCARLAQGRQDGFAVFGFSDVKSSVAPIDVGPFGGRCGSPSSSISRAQPAEISAD